MRKSVFKDEYLANGRKGSNGIPDILDEAKVLMAKDESLSTDAKTDAQFAGYVYTRYNRVRKGLQKQMVAIGYGK